MPRTRFIGSIDDAEPFKSCPLAFRMGPDFTKAFLQDLGRGKLSEPKSVFNPDMLLQRIQSLLFCVKKSLCPYVCVCV